MYYKDKQFKHCATLVSRKIKKDSKNKKNSQYIGKSGYFLFQLYKQYLTM